MRLRGRRRPGWRRSTRTPTRNRKISWTTCRLISRRNPPSLKPNSNPMMDETPSHPVHIVNTSVLHPAHDLDNLCCTYCIHDPCRCPTLTTEGNPPSLSLKSPPLTICSPQCPLCRCDPCCCPLPSTEGPLSLASPPDKIIARLRRGVYHPSGHYSCMTLTYLSLVPRLSWGQGSVCLLPRIYLLMWFSASTGAPFSRLPTRTQWKCGPRAQL